MQFRQENLLCKIQGAEILFKNKCFFVYFKHILMYSTSVEYRIDDYPEQVAQEEHIYMFHFREYFFFFSRKKKGHTYIFFFILSYLKIHV